MPRNHVLSKSVALFVVLFCFSVVLRASEIKCTLSLNDRVLDVKIEVPANRFEKTSFALSDWAGQSNFADNIYRVAARDKNGKPLPLEKNEARKWVVGNAKKAFELSYTVVAQKDSFMGAGARNHFHPTIFKDYAFLWGMSFLFFPEEQDVSRLPVRLRVIPNEYARFYTNFESRADSFDDLSDFFLAAGDYRVAEKNIGGRSVKFLLRGTNWKFTDEQFTGAVAQIIEAQTKYMGFSPSPENLLITLTEGTPASKGGTVVKNVISVYPDPQAGLQDFDTLKLIAHEHFHFWNGNYWRDAGDKKEGYYKWMSEGFTEYYAGLTLFRENLITEKQFVAWLNNLLLEYQTNPQAATATAEMLAEKYWESQHFNRLPYVKGALLGFLTDLRIRRKTAGKKQIDDLMRLLMSSIDRPKGYTDALLLSGFDTVSQLDNRQFYADFMLGARFLPIVEVLKDSEIAAANAPREVFELGFTTENGRFERGGKIKEVTSPSAIDAGLKPGDELRAFSFNYGRAQEQASFTVRRGDETRQLKYFPKKTVDLLQIDENARIPR